MSKRFRGILNEICRSEYNRKGLENLELMRDIQVLSV